MPKIHKPWLTHEDLELFLGGGVLDVLDHAATHEVGGGDLVDFASLTGFGTYIDQALLQASTPVFAGVTLGNLGLHILDTGGDHYLTIKPNEDLSASRVLSIITGDAARTITLSGNPTLGDWFDQGVKQASNVQFADGYFTGKVGIQTATPTGKVGIFAGSNDNVNMLSFQENADTDTFYFEANYAGVGATNNWLTMKDWSGHDVMIWRGDSYVGIGKVPTEKLDVDGKVKATEFLGNLHWDYITNEPLYYPPEYHYHVGKDIVSLHLVDLDDVEADDIFDVLPTAAIHGEGNYDWWGTWDTTAPANTSAEIVVLAGDDKMLQLVDNNNASFVKTELTTDAGHPIVTGVVQFQMRVTVANNHAYFELDKDAVSNMYIYFGTAPQTIRFLGGVAEENLGFWVANTWYTFRIHFDCVARAAVVFLDNVFKARIALSAAAAGDYVSTLRARTATGYDGYNVEINNLKVFNLTI